MPRRNKITLLPGPAGPGPEQEQAVKPVDRHTPSLGSFVRSRVVSANGVVAALYLTLSIWVLLHPRRAAQIWKRLQGEKSSERPAEG